MKKCREKDLAFWKAEAVSWRNVEAKATNTTTREYAAYFHRMSKRICERIESKIFVLLACLILTIGGCAKIMRGSGLIAEGLGDGVVAAGQHLQESTNQEK